MKTHYCKADRDWISFEGECSWCGMKEEDVREYDGLSEDQLFEEVMRRVNRNARPDITDD